MISGVVNDGAFSWDIDPTGRKQAEPVNQLYRPGASGPPQGRRSSTAIWYLAVADGAFA